MGHNCHVQQPPEIACPELPIPGSSARLSSQNEDMNQAAAVHRQATTGSIIVFPHLPSLGSQSNELSSGTRTSDDFADSSSQGSSTRTPDGLTESSMQSSSTRNSDGFLDHSGQSSSTRTFSASIASAGFLGISQGRLWRPKVYVRNPRYPRITAPGCYFQEHSGGFSLIHKPTNKYLGHYTRAAITSLEKKYAEKGRVESRNRKRQ